MKRLELPLNSQLTPLSYVSPQEKQTKEALTRKQQKGKKKGGQEEESHEAPELLKRPKEYTVKFTFPNPPPLSPPILGLHSKNVGDSHTSAVENNIKAVTGNNVITWQSHCSFCGFCILQVWTLVTMHKSLFSKTWTLELTWTPEVSFKSDCMCTGQYI